MAICQRTCNWPSSILDGLGQLWSPLLDERPFRISLDSSAVQWAKWSKVGDRLGDTIIYFKNETLKIRLFTMLPAWTFRCLNPLIQFKPFRLLPLARGLPKPLCQTCRAFWHSDCFRSMALGSDFNDSMKFWRNLSTSATVGLLRFLRAAKSRSELDVPAPTLARPACTKLSSERTSWPLAFAFLTDSAQHKKSFCGDFVRRLASRNANGLHSWNWRHSWMRKFDLWSPTKFWRPSIRSGVANLSSMRRCSDTEWAFSFVWNKPKLLMSSKSGHSAWTVSLATATQAAISLRQLDL